MSDGNPTQLCLHIHSGSFGSKPSDFLVHVGFRSPFTLHLLYFGGLWERFGREPASLLLPVYTLSGLQRTRSTHQRTGTQFNTVTQ